MKIKKKKEKSQVISIRIPKSAKKALLKKARGMENLGQYFKNLAYRDGVHEIFPEIVYPIVVLPPRV